MIGEIMFLSYGYLENRKCGKKMVATFKLCSEQLSSQDHYDYGMRAVKTVIVAAGNLKRAAPDEREEALLLRALQDVNVPKFLAHDLPLFAGILSDLFPGIERPPFDYGPLLRAIKVACEDQNLQSVPIFIRKVIELYEMICVRHGLMVVGPTGGGKSRCIWTLKFALSQLHKEKIEGERYTHTEIYHCNPKSINMGQLYGQFDPNTNEWQDGILAGLMRTAIKHPDKECLKWMLIDGPVDAIWIENMNTVLDDNKKLCLTSGEIMGLTEPMTMMFEPEDLAVASPATVSRCGMIYMEPKSLGYDPIMLSWLNTLPKCFSNDMKASLMVLFETYVTASLNNLRRNLFEPLPTVDNCLVVGLMNIIDCLIEEFRPKDGVEPPSKERIGLLKDHLPDIFIFALIWSIMITSDETGRKWWNVFLRTEMDQSGTQCGLRGTSGRVFEYYFDMAEWSWMGWMETQPPYQYDSSLTFSELIIPTKDSIAYSYFLRLLVSGGCHVLMTGPTGTGKSVNIATQLQDGFNDKFIPLTLAFSAQTSANQTQDLIDSKCEKRRKGVFGPQAGKRFILFIDDVNMPAKEEYGAQPPIEILRQWFDSGGWYDRKELSFRNLIDLIYVTACGPPGGGRNHVSARFYRHFNVIGYTEMQTDSMTLIFETILHNFLTRFTAATDDLQVLCEPLVAASIDVYLSMLMDMRPTPAKSHYQFNLRDLSKIFQGLLMVDPKKVDNKGQLARSWVHECRRIFCDRLINDEDRTWFHAMARQQLEKHSGMSWDVVCTHLKHHEPTEGEEGSDAAAAEGGGAEGGDAAAADKQPEVAVEVHDAPNDTLFMFCDFLVPGAEPRIYDEVDDLSELQPLIEEYLNEYNAESKQPMHLVMFMDAIEHVSRIARVLRQPQGNALLLGVGGSGRKSLTQLATFMADYTLYTIQIAKGYGMNEWRENLRECLLSAGLQDKPVVFMFDDTQIVFEAMTEDVNAILNSGDVPNLYQTEDLDAIAQACKEDCVRKRLPQTKLNLFSMYLTRVRRNIHVVLTMSPIGEAFRERMRKFPSIVNCCTIDWFSAWPDEALQSVATRAFIESNTDLGDHTQDVVDVCKGVHQAVVNTSLQFKSELNRHNYVTPTSYLELLSTYRKVLANKRSEVGTLKDRLQNGLDKLISTGQVVSTLEKDITALKPILVKTVAEVEEMIIKIDKDKEEAGVTQAAVEIEEAAALKKAAETKAIADDAQADLDEALPALDAAVQCLKDLKKSDIDEVKALQKPPAGVKLCMEAVCIMFEVKPVKVADPDTPGKKIDDYFKASQSTVLAKADKLLEDMQQYDKDNIPERVIKRIKPFIDDPNFTPVAIEKASKACKAMCMWVRAMDTYNRVVLMVEPKKKMLAEAQASLEITMSALAEAQGTLKGVMDKIARLESEFTAANTQKLSLEAQFEEATGRLERAGILTESLGSESVRWTESCARLTAEYGDLIGDSLISASTIAYAGAFTPDFRKLLVTAWREMLVEHKIPHSPGVDVRATLADQVQMRNWKLCELPQDSHSVENAIVMAQARRYSLFIDPQGQANKFIKNMGRQTKFAENGLDVVKLSDKSFLRSLENGVRFGKWVLLENVGEALDASLETLLLQQKFRQGGQEMIKIGDSVIPWNDSFNFFITTKLPNPHYPPEVCVKVSLLNFAITFSGLEDQLLGVTVVEERPDMEEKKNSLVIANARMQNELADIESTILKLLKESSGNILDDVELIDTLANSKKTSEIINAKVKEAAITEKEIDTNRELYRPVAFHVSMLYFCISGLSIVDPMYQFSLQWFTNLFVQGCRRAEPSENFEERLHNLEEFFTYYLYCNICRSLFEKDKLLFSFALTVRILQGHNLVDPDEWRFLISGTVSGGSSDEEFNYQPPEWVDKRMWSEITSLSRLPAFKGFDRDFPNLVDAWRDYYDAISPQDLPLPGKWNDQLNSFQKLAALRCLRVDKVPDAIMTYVIEKQGSKYVEPPPFHLPSCYEDSTCTTPLIFVLSKGSDPTKAFMTFAQELKFDKKLSSLSLGQGQGTKAKVMIENGAKAGFWVFLQNCHLYISWMTELERICEELTPETTHKDFRLWLTSMPSEKFPVSILQNGVKMINEPPAGLKSNLRSAFFKLDDARLHATTKAPVWRKLLFGMRFFHAVAQERRKFGPLGWNRPYEFNDTDVDISQGQLELFLDAYDNVPYRVIQFLTSFINYGGRVTDAIDIRTMDVIMRMFCNENLLSDDYKFDRDGVYMSISVDAEAPRQGYLDYIDTLPMSAGPAVFGLHENANIMCAQREAFAIFDTILLMTAGGGGGGGAKSDELIDASAASAEEKLRQYGLFDNEQISLTYPVQYGESMNTVLLQECIRFNKLIDVMQSTLPMLRKALKGLVVMSGELDAMGQAILINAVPAVWENLAYPSMKPYMNWVDDLMARLQFVHDWVDGGIPPVFWVSGFYFPQGFLTAILQNYARKYQYPIDTIDFNFIYLEEHYTTIKKKPDNGAFIHGLFMEGARWDPEIKSVNDSLPKQLYTEMPTLLLDPIKDRPATKSGVYRLPIYKILSRAGVLATTGHSTNFVMWMEIPSNRTDIKNNLEEADQQEWIMGGVAAFCSLKY